jgi:hypothetical protein
MERKISKTITWLVVFSIAMGFMESAVVVYLRKIYYPDGFVFPLQTIDGKIAFTEIFREAATITMLLTVGILAGRTKTERFGFFVFCFGIWDITYYIFLKLILGWPESLLNWDILFLIPVTWVGPVIGPVINSLTMILLALLITHFTNKGIRVFISSREWLLFILGSLIIIFSYTEDYLSFMLNEFDLWELFTAPISQKVIVYAREYVPQYFNWGLFIAGQVILLTSLLHFYGRNRKILRAEPGDN